MPQSIGPSFKSLPSPNAHASQATLTSKIVSGGGIILDVSSRWVSLDAYLLLDGVLDLLVKCKAERPYCPFAYWASNSLNS